MKTKIKIKNFVVAISFLPMVLATKSYAMCPFCTLAVGSALVLLEKYGVDNAISGVWIGGLLVSTSVMTINWLRAKNSADLFTELLIFLFYYSSIILFLHHKMIIGNPAKMLWGMDKVMFGIGAGGLLFYLAGYYYQKIKEKNNGHAQFPFQKIILPISPLVFLSVLFYFITK